MRLSDGAVVFRFQGRRGDEATAQGLTQQVGLDHENGRGNEAGLSYVNRPLALAKQMQTPAKNSQVYMLKTGRRGFGAIPYTPSSTASVTLWRTLGVPY